MNVVSRFTADLPNSVIGIRPGHGQNIPDLDNPAFGVTVDRIAFLHRERDRIEHLSVDVELLLGERGITKPNRLLAPISFEKGP